MTTPLPFFSYKTAGFFLWMTAGVILGHYAMGTLYLWNLEIWHGVPGVWESHPLRMNPHMGIITGGLIAAFVITSGILIRHGIIYRLHIVAVLSSGAILFFFVA